jgi:glutaminyl-tRNA synthetase
MRPAHPDPDRHTAHAGNGAASPAPGTSAAAAAASDGTPAGDGEGRPLDFIRAIIAEDLRTGKHDGRVATRFPPEPNGYLHIGHAKSICLNFGIAEEHPGATCNLRFDDTNPLREEQEYVDSIQEDIRWLGYDWGDRLYYASDYFEQLYEFALRLIRKGKAYVCDLSADEVRAYRGTLTEPGRNSPHRDRSVEENLDLFERMRAGEFEDGARTLRAKIDMAAPNLLMRDPTIYRIRRATHHRTGDAWCIYPLYDFTHCLSDAIEGITHSLCSIEFENNRPLYDWFVREVETEHTPRQIEFARLEMSHTIVSTRRLRRMIEEGYIRGWDDPRLATIRGMRRRGYPPEAIRDFCDRIGVAKRASLVELQQLEYSVREHLNRRAPRYMAVLRPVRVVIENFPEGRVEEMEAVNNPEDPGAGTRRVPFTRELWIERDDFREDPPRKFHRLSPGKEVRLRYAYIVKCVGVVKDPATGEVSEIRCTYDPETRGGAPPDGRKVRGTIHWVSAAHAAPAEVRLYDSLFTVPEPTIVRRDGETVDYVEFINPDSLEVLEGCLLEPALGALEPGARVQFERLGYFCVDPDSDGARRVFNRTVTLRDTWAKIEAKMQETAGGGAR